MSSIFEIGFRAVPSVFDSCSPRRVWLVCTRQPGQLPSVPQPGGDVCGRRGLRGLRDFLNARKRQENGFFLLVGIACLFAGVFDLLHALTYQGMSICPGMNADDSIQLKTAGRWVAGTSFLIGPLFLHRRINRTATFLRIAFLAVVLCLVFTNIFPTFYRPGSGMTLFQQISRGLSGSIFLAAAALLVRRRGEFDRAVFGSCWRR